MCQTDLPSKYTSHHAVHRRRGYRVHGFCSIRFKHVNQSHWNCFSRYFATWPLPFVAVEKSVNILMLFKVNTVRVCAARGR